MSYPVIEVATLTLGDRLKADHSLIKPTVDTLFQQPGCKKISWGILIEEENKGIVFVEWESLDAHLNFSKQPHYKPFTEELLALLTGSEPIKFIHVPFKPFPPSNALQGPIVEYTLFNTKTSDPNAKEELEKVTKEILDLADKHPKCHGTAFAPAVENPDQLVLLLSWPTVEAHTVEYRGQEVFQPLYERVVKYTSGASIVHMEIKHLN